jgi:hypothetical protein
VLDLPLLSRVKPLTENDNVKHSYVRKNAASAAIILIMLVFADSVPAQQFLGAKAGILQQIQGEVFLDGNLLRLPRGSYIQLENGQRLSTEQGYLELVLNSGAYLRLGENGLLRMEQNRLDDTQVVLERGSALIEVVDKTRGRIRVRLSTGYVEINKAGLYRLDAGSGELRVYGGAAVVANGNRKATIKRERMVRLDGDPASEKFDANAADALHEWAAQRSFDLFLANLGNDGQVHWKPVSLGWLRNFNYRMSFYSDQFRTWWIIDQQNQELAAERQRAAWATQQDQQRQDVQREQMGQATAAAEAKERETHPNK